MSERVVRFTVQGLLQPCSWDPDILQVRLSNGAALHIQPAVMLDPHTETVPIVSESDRLESQP